MDFLVMLGPPGAGKGTLNRLLSDRFGYRPVSTGEVIRREMANPDSPFGQAARPHMDRGDYVPDDLALSLFFSILKPMSDNARVALDGFPRTIPQAEVFLDWIRKEGHAFHGCVFLDVDVDTAVKRMRDRRVCRDCRAPYHLLHRPPKVAEVCDLCGGPVIPREDDDPERVARRIRRFQEQTNPLLQWFAERDKRFRLDGALAPEENADRVAEHFQLT